MAAYSARKPSGPLLRSAPPPNRQFPSRTPSFRSNSSSVSFSLDRSGSANPSVSVSTPPAQKRTCMCSPTNHPGSFRCSLHKSGFGSSGASRNPKTTCASSTRLSMRRSAMTNSLVRIGTVEGDLVRRALAALIRPSSHHQRRRAQFKPCASRLSRMSR